MISLNEAGLLRNDLDYLVLPLVELDTYESKIDNAKAVVVAFYVFEQEPAKDLERFIEKGDITILDAETSPAPTEDGYYVVFIEMDRNADLPELLVKMVDSVDNLTNVDQWQFKTLHDDEIYDLTEDNIKEHVNLDPESVPPAEDDIQDDIEDADQEAEETEEEPNSMKEYIAPILKNGLMESIEILGDTVFLTSPGSTLKYRVAHISKTEPSVPIIGFEIGNPLINESARLSKVLGSAYTVEAVDNGLLVSSDNGYLILELLD